MKETIIESLEKWARIQPDKLAWQFHNDKLEVEDTFTFKVCIMVCCELNIWFRLTILIFFFRN